LVIIGPAMDYQNVPNLFQLDLYSKSSRMLPSRIIEISSAIHEEWVKNVPHQSEISEIYPLFGR